MKKFESTISKWKFKKIVLVYIIIVLVVSVICAALTGYVLRERISFAWQYSKLSETAEKGDTSSLQGKIDNLAASSSNIVDILVLDENNQVTYSAKQSEFKTGSLNLTRAGDEKNYLVSDENPDVVFRLVKGDELMMQSVLNKDFGEIRHEYDDEKFYENGSSNRTVYMLSYIGEHNNGTKIYIISNPASVPYGMLMLKIDAGIAALLFMIYWVLVALWTFQNALKAKLYPIFWGVIVLFTNLAGVVVYALYKRGNTTCPSCGVSQSKSHIYCANCGKKIMDTCENCGAHISSKDSFCTHCGAKIK